VSFPKRRLPRKVVLLKDMTYWRKNFTLMPFKDA